jgi:ribosome-binding protein aMBF1 (putative translation factor)
MKKDERIKALEKAWKYKLITLKPNNCLTNDPCVFCGKRCDPDGFDYFATGTYLLVCDQCAAKYTPDIVAIREAAKEYAKGEVYSAVGDFQMRIKNSISSVIKENDEEHSRRMKKGDE